EAGEVLLQAHRRTLSRNGCARHSLHRTRHWRTIPSALRFRVGKPCMALTISTHRVGNVTVLTCSGCIVQGSESEKLRQFVTDALKHGPFIVLDFHDVEFLDSSGLGLLARLLDRSRAAAGNLKVCALSP